jgi:hypothetical protein
MSNRIHVLAQQLTGKASIEECSLDEVQIIAQRYPYFAPAQFLLLQKLKETTSPDSEAQQKKAVLYFHDPLLFEYFISSDKFYNDQEVNKEKAQDVEPVIVVEENIVQGENEIVEEYPIITGDPIESESIITEEKSDDSNEEKEDFISEPETEKLERSGYKENSFHDNVEKLTVEGSIEIKNSSLPGNEGLTVAEEEERNINQSVAAELSKLSNSNSQSPSEELAFEPYHTVDYFASQGIKVSLNDLPKDRLGKQLKSFTDWLKTMKRLPSAQATEAVETSAEIKVENMANHSVTESNVVTEAMAEVWAKQGNKQKALDIYNKLSLLNPSKKAYFAAKIEHLKLS